jgi:hypothetical protein
MWMRRTKISDSYSLQESIQIKVDATAGAGRMLDFCRRKEDQVRNVLSRMCFIFLVFPCIMILQHQQLLLLSHSTDPAANCLRRRWEKSRAGISSDALSSLKTERLIALVVRFVCVLSLWTLNPGPNPNMLKSKTLGFCYRASSLLGRE